jgi:hypothetical protein
MLRNVVVHLHNEQPLLADLPNEPTPSDTCLICTNLRTTDGRAPVFVDRGDSTFVFPLAHIRFLEVRAESYADGGWDESAASTEARSSAPGLPGGNRHDGAEATDNNGRSGGDVDEDEILRRVRDA